MSDRHLPARTDIVLLRHGQTPWSEIGRYAGRTDLPLTEQGEDLARAARGKIAGFSFDKVFASPLKRALRSAELLGYDNPEIDARLLERDYGDYEGLTTPEIRARAPGWNVWSDPIPGGEPLEEMTARVDSFIRDVHASGDRMWLVVAHAHVLRLFAARWLELEPVHAGLFRIGTLGLVHMGWERERPVMHRWNA